MSVQLTLASGSGVPGGTVSLDVSIASTGGSLCTDIQFVFSYPADLTLMSVTIGAAGTAASKSLSRTGDSCLISALNSNVIGDGQLATAVFQIAASPAAPSPLTVTVGSVVASDVDANLITSSGGTGDISYSVAPSPLVIVCPVGSGSGTVGVLFTSAAPAVSGGAPPYVLYELLSGPPWMTINSTTGVVSGVPTGTGSFNYVIRVTDSLGATATT